MLISISESLPVLRFQLITRLLPFTSPLETSAGSRLETSTTGRLPLHCSSTKMILVLSVLHVWDRDVDQLAEGETWGPMNALDHLASRIKAKVFPLSVSLIHAPLSCRMETSDPEDALHSPFCIYFIRWKGSDRKTENRSPDFVVFVPFYYLLRKGYGVCVCACAHVPTSLKTLQLYTVFCLPFNPITEWIPVMSPSCWVYRKADV